MERAYEKSLGTVLVVLGVGILLFGFVLAYQELQGLPTNKAPTAKFDWSLSGTTASFTDLSSAGAGSLSTTYWSFGDGSSSNSSASPTHTYPTTGRAYNVTLQVQDSDGGSAESTAILFVQANGTSSGASSPSGPVGNQTNVGSIVGPLLGGVSGLVKTAESFFLLVVVWLVGGAILRGGWNLVTPKSETISVRVRPRSLQVEPVTPPPSAPAAAPPVGPPPSG